MRCSIVMGLVLLAGCSASPPTYKCVKTVTAGPEIGGEIASSGGVAYVGGENTISVFDVSKPSDVKVLTALAFPQRVEAIATGGNRLVAAGAQQLIVYDITDATAPVKLGQLNTTATSRNALVTDGHWVWAGSPTGQVAVYDISAATPTLATKVSPGPLPINDLVLKGTTLYAAGGVFGSLVAFDISQPGTAIQKTVVDVEGQVVSLALDGNALFAYTGQAGPEMRAQRLDVSSPLEPKLVATSTDLCACTTVAVTVQSTIVHGQFVAPLTYGKGLGAWPENNVVQTAGSIGETCIPNAKVISNVHLVGESLIISGNDSIGFLAP